MRDQFTLAIAKSALDLARRAIARTNSFVSGTTAGLAALEAAFYHLTDSGITYDDKIFLSAGNGLPILPGAFDGALYTQLDSDPPRKTWQWDETTNSWV